MKWLWVDDLRTPKIAPQWLAYALVLASTGLMIVAGWVAVHEQLARERSLAAETALRQTENRAIALEQYVARTIEGADLVTRHIADRYLRSGLARPSRRPIAPILIRDPVVDGTTYGVVTIVSPEGDLLATSSARAAQPSNVAQSPVFVMQAAHPGTDLLISRPFKSRILGDTFVYFTRRVLADNGDTLGFVGVQIRPSDLSNFVQSVRFEPTDLISVIGFDGITRVRREGNRVSFGEDVSDRLVMQMQRRSPNGSYVGPSSLDGHVRYFSHRRMPDYPIFVTAGISQAATLAPIERRARLYFAVMGLLTVASLLLAALIIVSIRRRHAHAKALTAANDRLRAAQCIARIGDWECDLETGAILWSDQLCEMYERDPCSDRLTLHDFYQYLDEDGQSVVARAIASALSTGEPQTYEFKAYLPSGAISDRFVNALPVKSDEGIVTSLVGTDQDVTADKLVESLQEQINHLSRVDAMNTMAATLAHELNQPLTAASNYLSGGERMLTRGDDASRTMAAEAFAAARQQVQTVGDIIRRVREMIESERRAGESVEIRGLISDTIESLVQTEDCLREWVRYDVDPGADSLWGDRVQIQQVLMNLIRNACEAAAVRDRPLVHVRVRPLDDEFVEFTVTDNGLGVSGRADQLFSPFSSTKMNGLGLGLSISRTIVEYHGGRIWLSGNGDRGAAISFSVRARAEDPMPVAETS